MDSIDEYISNVYGRCSLDRCLCIDPIKPRFGGEWIGTMCPDWMQLTDEEKSKLKKALTIKSEKLT